MNKRFVDMLFILILISAPFKLVNQIFWLPGFISGPFWHHFVAWPLLIGLLYTGYCQWKYGNVFYGWGRFWKYIAAYWLVLFVSLAYGLLVYPYWDMFLNGQAMNNAKFAFAVGLAEKLGFSVREEAFLSFWVGLRSIKNIVISTFYTVGGAYMIFCWYRDRAERALYLLKNVTVGFLVVIAAYGVVDMCYQNGQWWAQNFISVMWPILHTNPEGSYFPMFLGARNRSLFLEASYYAIYMAFAFPILWWKIMESKGKMRMALALLYLLLACEIYLGQSRTGMAMFWGELGLLALVTIYKRKRKLFVSSVCLVLGAMISFVAALGFLQYCQVPARLNDRTPLAEKKMKLAEKQKTYKEIEEILVQDYIDDSLLSLVDKDKAKKRAGSNHTRYGVTFADIEIGMKHPILGVGTGLETAYHYDTFKNDQGWEIKNRFIKPLEEKGLLDKGAPMMCEYSRRFVQGGILGLVFFLMPMGGALLLLGRRLLRKTENEEEFYTILFVTLADVGISVTGFGNTVNITYAYWLMVGVSYVVELALRRRDARLLDEGNRCV